MQNASVNIVSSEAVMFSKQTSRNSENLHRRLTPPPPPLSEAKEIKRLST